MTPQGAEKLRRELGRLKEERPKISREIGVAREHGDLSENAEYHAAKEKLQQVLDRISDLQWKLSHVKLTDDLPVKDGAVTLGCQVVVKDEATGREQTYTLVGPDEADPANGQLSMASPIGKALLGQQVKAKVVIQLPAGPRTVQILSISR